nr:hypothetical protein [Sphingomonas jinjuensis]
MPTPPLDWSAVPPLRYRNPPPENFDYSAYVRDEVRAGRCHRAVAVGGRWTLVVDVIVLAARDGSPRRIIPRAIDCPSVEQYAAGLVSRLARRNVDTGGAATDGWYKTSVRFSWPA